MIPEDLLAAAAQADPDPLRASSALRRAFPEAGPDLIGAALTQIRLRRRAEPRLGTQARQILLTEAGLEQATRAEVARIRAERLAGLATHVADLGCGIGTESWAMARAGLQVRAVERDVYTAEIARHNARALGLADHIDIRTGDITDSEVLAWAVDGADAAFLDPARRDADGPRAINGQSSRRLLAPEQWSPPWSFVRELSARIPVVAKVAPGIDLDLVRDAHVVFTSHDGDLVEASVWFQPLGEPGKRTAQVVHGNTAMTLTTNSVRPDDIAVSEPLSYLLDPDDAIARADVLHLILERGGSLIDPHVAYITRSSAPDAGERWLGTWYEVLAWLPFNIRELRWKLAELGIGNVTIAKRAFAGDVDDIRKQLRLNGGLSATVVLTRTDAGPLALICRLVS